MKKPITILILLSSIFCYDTIAYNPDDYEKAKRYSEISSFGEHKERYRDLSNADLSEAGLYNLHDSRDLCGINLHNANCTTTDFSYSNLASITKPKPVVTDLSKAKLVEAAIESANLTGVNLEEADLTHAVLIFADLSHASLRNAILKDTDFTEAHGDYTDFSGSNYNEARGLDWKKFPNAKK